MVRMPVREDDTVNFLNWDLQSRYIPCDAPRFGPSVEDSVVNLSFAFTSSFLDSTEQHIDMVRATNVR